MYSAPHLGTRLRRVHTPAVVDIATNADPVASGLNFCLFVFAVFAPTLCVLPAIHTGAKIQCPLNIYFREATLFYVYIRI